MKSALASILVLLSIAICSGQSAQQRDLAEKQLERRGEVYFSFTFSSPDQINQLTRIISIDNVNNNKVFAYANMREFYRFLEYSLDYEVLIPPSEREAVAMSDDPKQVMAWNYYPTYTAYESIMSQFVTDYPSICQLVTIGTLPSGRKLLAVKITDNPGIQENEPEFLYNATMHGDETAGYVLMLHLIDYLLQNYGTDPRITEMINSTEIYINPLANPDGTYKGGNSTVYGATRYNANNVDLNRNYPDPEDGPHPDGNPWQPETIAFMNLAGFHHFTMAANFHGGAEVFNYPWDTWPQLTADNNWWIYIAREYADTCHANSPPTYFRDLENGITNGYAWYTTSGNRQDYMNYFHNCRESIIEISAMKLLPASQLENHWNYNYRSFLNHIEQSNYGLNGLVTDSLSGEPLYARVYISGHDIDSSHVFTDPAVGDYHRHLKAGNYSVTFSSPGYFSKTIPVQIVDRQKTVLNVQLYNGRLESNFTCDSPLVPIGATVHFTDQSAGNPESWAWVFEGGIPSISSDQNPTVTYTEPGEFTVKLTVTRTGSTDSLIREAYIQVKEWHLMGNENISTCDALFFDAGGPQNNYSNDESSVITFTTAVPGNRLKATFLSFGIEASPDCANDWLKVYDGVATTDPLIGVFCGSELPPLMLSSNARGALTFEFFSNGEITGTGWQVLLECDSNVGILSADESLFSIYPNPATSGNARIISDQRIDRVRVSDIAGRILLEDYPGDFEITIDCPFSEGIYLVSVGINNKTYTRKLIIRREE